MQSVSAVIGVQVNMCVCTGWREACKRPQAEYVRLSSTLSDLPQIFQALRLQQHLGLLCFDLNVNISIVTCMISTFS